MQICLTNWELWSVKKCRGKLSKGILLQQDNARVDTCKISMDAVEPNGYELIPHPAYSPDLAPWLFPVPKLEKGYLWTSFLVQRRSHGSSWGVCQRQGLWLLQFWADGTGTPLVHNNTTPCLFSRLSSMTISYSQTWKRISVDVISGPTKKSWQQLRSVSEIRTLASSVLGWWHWNTVGPSASF